MIRKENDSGSIQGASVAVILGSGLHEVSSNFTTEAARSFDQIEGLSASGVAGHRGEVKRCVIAGRRCVFVCGRKHYYEGGTGEIRALIAYLYHIGVRDLLVSSAAGSLVKTVSPGELVLVEDLLDHQFRPTYPERRSLRVRGTANGVERPGGVGAPALDRALSRRVCAAAAEQNLPLGRGVAITCAGPVYETPAEIRAFQQTGAALVTMSGAPEVGFASAMGIRVAMVALVTNWAAGISSTRLSHDDVLDVACGAIGEFRQLVEKFVETG